MTQPIASTARDPRKQSALRAMRPQPIAQSVPSANLPSSCVKIGLISATSRKTSHSPRVSRNFAVRA